MQNLTFVLALMALVAGCNGETNATDGGSTDLNHEGLRFPDSIRPDGVKPPDGVSPDIHQNPNDWDGDGLTNDVEQQLGLDPNNADTDNDGTDDKQEVGGDTQNPIDGDGDGKIDAKEPDNFDSDKDGTNDSQDADDKDGECGNVQRLFLFATISQDTTLDKKCSPYKVLGSLSVTGDAKLTVSGDVTVTFGPHATLYVGDNATKGSLALAGTKNSTSGTVHPVLFTADTQQPAKGYWRGVVVENGNSLTLSYATVEYGGDVTGGGDPKALVLVKAVDSIALNNSTLRQGFGFGLHAAVKNSAGKLFLGFQNNTFLDLDKAADLNIRHLSEIEKNNNFNSHEVHVSEGTVDQDGTWRTIGAPYVFEEQTIAIEAKLQIQEAVTLVLPTDAAFYVGYNLSGDLSVSGSSAAPVVFKTASSSAGSWQGLLLTTGSNNLKHVNIIGAGKQSAKGIAASLYVDTGASLSADNITITDSSGYGVYLYRSNDNCKDVQADEFTFSGSIAQCGLFCVDDTNSPGVCLKQAP